MSDDRAFFARHAWLPGELATDVRMEVEAGRFSAVTPGVDARPGDEQLPGVVVAGMANTHSHAFHRVLRGRGGPNGGSFWTWREQMYAVAARLEPDNYYALARAVFAEMALSGITCVGEFHYVHHRADGTPYDDPNAMGIALLDAARAAGIRITLLDACYLAGGLGTSGPLPLEPAQRRFSDGTATRWAERVARLPDRPDGRIGAAIHSVRAVGAEDISTVSRRAGSRPLHVHLSEQGAENEACERAYGLTPTALLARCGALRRGTTAVHATHLTPADITGLGEAGVGISFCPTTERDLADGIGAARALADAGAVLSLGTDQNTVIDLLEEARGLEMNERLTSQRRGRFEPAQLITMLTEHGHRALGWADAGRIAVGARADLVAVDTDSVRTVGADPASVLLTASAADVATVVVDGRTVVEGHRHRTMDVAGELARAITAVS